MIRPVLPVVTAQARKPPSSAAKATAASNASAKALEVTGQQRGFTNNGLYLKLDDGKEMTFLVDIPGDKDQKWQKDFATLSRITVTYHTRAGGPLPIATVLKKAPAGEKK